MAAIQMLRRRRPLLGALVASAAMLALPLLLLTLLLTLLHPPLFVGRGSGGEFGTRGDADAGGGRSAVVQEASADAEDLQPRVTRIGVGEAATTAMGSLSTPSSVWCNGMPTYWYVLVDLDIPRYL